MMQGGCPMCGRMGGQTQTEPANNPEAIRNQIRQLQERLKELEQGQTTPQHVQQQMPQMCPMCQGMMGGMGGAPDREEMEQGIQQQIRRLKERVRALERGRG